MSLMHYVSLGCSGLKVSPLCLGTMTFGMEWGWGSTPEEARAILDKYIEDGGNFIDTANFYTHGHSEKIIGDYFAKQPRLRQKTVVATKFFGAMVSGDPNSGGAGRKAIVAACNESLRRLRTDFIDLYWMHCYDVHTPIEETLRSLDDLVSDGKIRYIGFSDTPAWKVAHAQMLAQFKAYAPVIALQMEYSLLERGIEGEIIPCAAGFGMGLTPWSPLKSGVLSGKYRRENHGKVSAARGEWAMANLNDKAYRVIDELDRIARSHDASVAQIALAWLLKQPGVTSPIIGARTCAQLQDNLGALSIRLADAEVDSLSALTEPELNFPAAFVRRSGPFRSSGCTINGEENPVNPLIAQDSDQVY